MSVPLTATIERWCSSSLAIEILKNRGIITEAEASDLFARERATQDAAYERIYGRTRA